MSFEGLKRAASQIGSGLVKSGLVSKGVNKVWGYSVSKTVEGVSDNDLKGLLKAVFDSRPKFNIPKKKKEEEKK